MRAPGLSTDAGGLARHGRALRRLALALVRDEDLAQDLVQDTASTSRGATSVEHALARAQLQRLVADLVLGLEEPFRAAVVLRYIEGQPAVDITRTHGIPAATVRSRARDGLERIRAELDGRHGGDRQAWRLALLPLAGTAVPAAPAARPGGGLAPGTMNASTRLVTAATALVVVFAGAFAVRWCVRPEAAPAAFAASSGGRRLGGHRLDPPSRTNAAASIQGLVRSPSGNPVAGARVVLVPGGGLLSGYGTRVVDSTAAGFLLADLEAGSYTLSAGAPGYASTTRAITVRPGQASRGTDLTLSAGGFVLSGRVLDSSRVPLGGAVVEAIWRGRVHTVTDRSGAFSLTLAKGSYQLNAAAAGFASGGQWIVLGSDASTEFFLDPGADVQGRVVVRGSDRPVPDVTVVLLERRQGFFDSRRTISDREGQFEFRDLAAGTYQLLGRQVALTGQSREPLELAAAARVFQVVELEAGSTVSGLITGDGGQPLAAAFVAIGQQGVPGIWISGRTGPDGHFQLSGVLPGSWWVTASAPGYLGAYHSYLEVGKGAGARLDLALGKGVALEGRVLDQARQPDRLVSDQMFR